MRVLLADDSALILERLRTMVSRNDRVEIVGAMRNGTDTLRALRTLKPDLAIVDNKMPGLSGLEVLNEIRKEDRHLKFILLTYYATDYYRQLAEEAGVDYFLSKVDNFEMVAQLISQMTEQEEFRGNLPWVS